MIEIKAIAGTNIVEMRFEGSVNAAQFDEALGQFDALLKQHDTIKLLECIGPMEMPPIPWSRVWADVRFSFEYLARISHVAVVADQGWLARWVRIVAPLLKADVRHFPSSKLDEAREWIRSA